MTEEEIRADERERCAKVALKYKKPDKFAYQVNQSQTAKMIAAAIRALT